MNSKILGIKHSGQLGDIVYAMSFIKSFIKKNKFDFAIVFIASDKIANHAKGLNHISNDLMITQSMYEFIKPLLLNEFFIQDVLFMPEKLIPENVLDLDVIRNGKINLSAGNIKSYYYKFFGLIDKHSRNWLTPAKADNLHTHKIVIGRSTRYINQKIDYTLLNDFELNIGYLGTDYEYAKISELFPLLKIEKIFINNALDAAAAISQSSLYIGNQSLFFAIAEGLHHPRLLESFEPVPNVIPCPGNSGSFISTEGMMTLVSDSLSLNVTLRTRENNTSLSYLLSY